MRTTTLPIIALSGLLFAAPAFAQSNYQNATTGKVGSAQELVDQAMGTVQTIKSAPHFDNLLKQAKGIFIMPNLVKGAFIAGGEGAQGVLLKHDSSGSWSDPAFLTIGSISLGVQAGAKAGPAAMLLMTDKAVADFTQSNNFSLNAKSGLTIVNDTAQGQAPLGKGDIVIWSDQSGAFAGATLSAADVTQDRTLDHDYYHRDIDTRQILAGAASNSGASKLKSELPT